MLTIMMMMNITCEHHVCTDDQSDCLSDWSAESPIVRCGNKCNWSKWLILCKNCTWMELLTTRLSPAWHSWSFQKCTSICLTWSWELHCHAVNGSHVPSQRSRRFASILPTAQDCTIADYCTMSLWSQRRIYLCKLDVWLSNWLRQGRHASQLVSSCKAGKRLQLNAK